MPKILIVDDEAIIAFELETTLTAMGYEVTGTAGSGIEAVEMAIRTKPDLVLMDIMMPGELDGIAAAAKIKNTIDLSVIFLTAYTNEACIKRAKRVEPVGYLTKPFREEQVKAAIEIALYKKKMEQKLVKQRRLNELLLDSLPNPAMLINNDRLVLAANRKAMEAGTLVNDYCWKTFGKSAHIPDADRRYMDDNPNATPPQGIKCSFCQADESMRGKLSAQNAEVTSFGRKYDTYWVPIDDHTYLHYAIDITEHHQMEAALRKSHDELEARVEARTAELKSLSSQLLEVQETERKLIANDLHDSIGQILAAIKFGLENFIHDIKETTPQTDVTALQSLVPVVRQACDDVRRIHTDLRPPLLDDMGLVATIKWFCREMASIYRGIRIQNHVDIDEHQVPYDLKIVIFRIVQEALNNAVKHAMPNNIEVAASIADGKIRLAIKDDGNGFDQRKRKAAGGLTGGFGLRSMKERTEMSGGSFSIVSKPGHGTVLQATWAVNS